MLLWNIPIHYSSSAPTDTGESRCLFQKQFCGFQRYSKYLTFTEGILNSRLSVADGILNNLELYQLVTTL